MTGILNNGRDVAKSSLLINGKVLITGGSYTNGNLLNSAELYDPS